MTKNKIITSLIAGAVLFSALASYLIYHYMAPSRSTVYVFNSSYSSGEQITADMLTPVQVDSTIVVAGKNTSVGNEFVSSSDYQEVIRSGDSLRMDVSEGMPLTTSMLSVSGGSTIEMNMKSDAIAITIPVNEYTGVTNDLKAGSRVNIYSNMDSTTTLIQQNKRILEVFTDGGSISGVAIEENISESMELVNAVTNGSIYLGLVDSTGYQSSEGKDPSYNPYAATTDTVSDAAAADNTAAVDESAVIDSIIPDESEAETENTTESAEAETDTSAVFTP